MNQDRLNAAAMWLDETYGYGPSGEDVYHGSLAMLETLGLRWRRVDGRHEVVDGDFPEPPPPDPPEGTNWWPYFKQEE